MGNRLKVDRVIKLKAFKRARFKSNPFNLNDKDRKQLASFERTFDKLFVNF